MQVVGLPESRDGMQIYVKFVNTTAPGALKVTTAGYDSKGKQC